MVEIVIDDFIYYSSVHYMDAADIDGDLDIDLVATQYGMENHIVYYENVDGFGNDWGEQVIEEIECRQPIAVDLDLDGDLDIVAGEQDSDDPYNDEVHLWEHQNSQITEIQVLAPNGGEIWRTDTPHNIYWNSTRPEDVRIELFYDNQLVETITESTENDGVCNWLIPENLLTGDLYSIRLQIVGSPEQDFSDEPFSITSLPSLTIEPFQPSTIIPAAGGGYWYWVQIVNPSPFPVSGQLWAQLVLPNGNTYGPIANEVISIDPNSTYQPSSPHGQFVPGYAPPGIYQHVMAIGIRPNLVIDTDSFTFEKLAGTSGPTRPESQWSVSDWAMNGTPPVSTDDPQQTGQAIPTEFALLQPHPNPFNPTTSFTVQLPETANLQVTVHDITGRLVATLANGSVSAGAHTLTFDGSGLASGVYFLHALTADQHQSRKLLLLK